MQIETMRHDEVFSCHKFGQRRVDIIGVGATGSKVAVLAAKLGVQNLHVWDPDTVAAHNIANQEYDLAHVGQLKVDALQQVIERATGLKITAHPVAVNGGESFGDVVFLLTDTMVSRKTIWDTSLRMKLRTKLVIETRMGVDEGRIYTVNPCDMTQVARYEETLYTDVKASPSACGASVSVGGTAAILAGQAIWQFIRWFAAEQGKGEEVEQEVIFGLRPPMIFVQIFA